MKAPSLRVLAGAGAMGVAGASSSMAVPGAVDAGFYPVVNEQVNALAIQPDGKILAGGYFTFVDGASRPRVARLHANGSLDDGFNPQGNAVVRSVAVQANGGIILNGDFTMMGGSARVRVARVESNGTLADDFVVSANGEVRSTVFLSDGKILLGGLFTTMNGTTRNYLGRVDAAGGLDIAFNPSPNAGIRTPVLQPDGKLLLAGNFSSIAGGTRNRVARLNADGSLDQGFNANVSGTAVYCMALQADGKIVIGGTFTAGGRVNVARLNADGTLDAGFNSSANDIVRSVALQTDGKMIFTGHFTMMGGAARNRIARLNANGTLDTGFNPNANDVPYGVILQKDGKVVIGGVFTEVGGEDRSAMARLENDPAVESLTVPAPDRIEWLRSGASPETHEVTFEHSIDGGAAWTVPGPGIRMGGGWQATGLQLPAGGHVRARARTAGGYGNGSTGLLETITAYFFPAQQFWRHTHFGTIANQGSAADNADPDKDGVENLVEYAFARNPNVSDAAALPAWQYDDGYYYVAFTRPPNVTGITYIGEYSTSLFPGSWVAASDAGTPPNYSFVVPALTRRLYLRLRVTSP